MSVFQLEWNGQGSLFLCLLPRSRLDSVMGYMCREDEFLSPHGIRSLSKVSSLVPMKVYTDQHYTGVVRGSRILVYSVCKLSILKTP